MVFKQNHTIRQILDSLEANVYLLDEEGNIEEINNSCLEFVRENSTELKYIDKNVDYLAVCEKVDKKDKDAELAKKFADGIRAVINGQKLSFEMEYPCHSPDKQRWFRGLVTPFIESKPGQKRKVIVFHEDITEKILTEKKQVSVDYFLNKTLELVAYLDTELNIVWANRAAGNSVGKTTADITGKKCYEIWHQYAVPCENCPVKKALKIGQLTTGEIVDDLGRLFHITASPVKDEESGKIIGAVETRIEITEKKELEQELSVKERAVEASLDAIALADLEGNLIYVNSSFLKLLGYEDEKEVLGFSLLDLLQEAEEAEKAKNIFNTILSEGQWSGDLSVKRKDNELIEANISASLSYNEDNTYITVVTSFVDITEQKETERALVRFRNALDSSADSIFIIGYPSFNIFDVNKAACIELGCSKKEFIQMTPCDIKPFISKGELKEKFFRVRERSPVRENSPPKTLHPETFETYHQRKNGSIFPVEISLRYSDIPEEQWFIVSARNITERKKIEEEREKNETRLQSLVDLFKHDVESVEELIFYAFKEAIKLTESKLGHFYKYDEDKEELTLLSYSEEAKEKCSVERYGEVRQLDEAGIWAEAVRRRKPIVINDQEDNHLKRGQTEGHVQIYRYLGVPVFREDKIVAVMGVANKEYGYTQTDILQLSLFLDNVWKALDRKWAEDKIRYISFHDRLTGLYNRAFLEEEIERLDVAKKLPISIIMADINGLKLVNDTYGYKVGDKLLKSAGKILINSIRRKNATHKNDIIVRWGGDEFVIFLVNTTKEEALKVSRRIKEECTNFEIDPVPVRIAVGTATKEDHDEPLETAFKMAEDRMYQQKLTEANSARSKIISALLGTLKEKSDETEAHALRMTELGYKFGNILELDEEDMDKLSLLATMHDIGKITISEEILKKPGKLTEKEWEKIKEHPETGQRIARTTEDLIHIAEEISAHHERWDGNGYPAGLKGQNIPYLARVIAIKDTYDVMTHDRSYRKAVSKQEALEEIENCAGTQFDPELARIFVRMVETQENL